MDTKIPARKSSSSPSKKTKANSFKLLMLEPRLRKLVYAFLPAETLFSLSLLSKTLKGETQEFAKESLKRTLRFLEWKDSNELWDIFIRSNSQSPKMFFPVIFTAIEHDNIRAVKKILKTLSRRIAYLEVVKKLPNGLFPINLSSLSRIVQDSHSNLKPLYKEILHNHSIKTILYSGIINTHGFTVHKAATPFHEVCSKGRHAIFPYFKKYAANPNVADSFGTTCIHAAIRGGHTEIVHELLAMNANCTSTNNLGETPLMLTCDKRFTDLALLLLEKVVATNSIENQKALSLACKNGLIEVATKMLNKGISKCDFGIHERMIDVNNTALEKKTPLVFAAENNQIELIKLLLSKGAIVDLFCEADCGLTALMSAIKNGKIDAAKELLEHAAQPLPQSKIEHSAYSAALESENYCFIRHLLNYYVPTKNEIKRLFRKYRKTPKEVCEWLLQNAKENPKIVYKYEDPTVIKLQKKPVSAMLKRNNAKDKKPAEVLIKEINTLVEENNKNLESISYRLQNLDSEIKNESHGRNLLCGHPTIAVASSKSPKKKVKEAMTSTKNAKDCYYDYLSPEKGEGFSYAVKKTEEHNQLLPYKRITCLKSTEAKQSLTPAYKLLDVSPYVLRNKSHQAKKLVDLLSKRREVHAKLSTTSSKVKNKRKEVDKKRPATPAVVPTTFKRLDKTPKRSRKESCASQRDPIPASDKPPQDLPTPDKSKAKTILSKYQSPNQILHVKYIEFDSGKPATKKRNNKNIKQSTSQGSKTVEDDLLQDGYLSEPKINMLGSLDNENTITKSMKRRKKKRSKLTRLNSPLERTRPLSALVPSRSMRKEESRPKPNIKTSPLLTANINFPLFMNGRASELSPMEQFVAECIKRPRTSAFEGVMKERMKSAYIPARRVVAKKDTGFIGLLSSLKSTMDKKQLIPKAKKKSQPFLIITNTKQ